VSEAEQRERAERAVIARDMERARANDAEARLTQLEEALRVCQGYIAVMEAAGHAGATELLRQIEEVTPPTNHPSTS
jgi:hypothetical protein